MGTRKIPVIDLFAGPGGLGEGFSSYEMISGESRFKIALSIEMDPYAHETLSLRAFFRQFARGKAPLEYYQRLRREIDTPALFGRFKSQAEAANRESWQHRLGEKPDEVKSRIDEALDKADEFVLIGGPPCQAYSIAGRSRNKGISDYVPEKDHRQYLYLEYLRIIADHAPAVFVMENVKGILSATVKNQRMFERIQDDLKNPAAALQREGRPRPRKPNEYVLFPLTSGTNSVQDFIIRCESYGVPQARHRVIILGIRHDLLSRRPDTLTRVTRQCTVADVLKKVPILRSGLSEREDSISNWRTLLLEAKKAPWMTSLRSMNLRVYHKVLDVVDSLPSGGFPRGSEFLPYHRSTLKHKRHREWFVDSSLGGLCNHYSRTHMDTDIHRYLFASSFTAAERRSPALRDFPPELLPDHRNVEQTLNGGLWAIRILTRLSCSIISALTLKRSSNRSSGLLSG